jgi:transcriptional regulator with XRE-family HTH domain
MSELGKLLKELRGKKSLRAVAEDTGLSHSYIADIEKGFRRDTKAPINPSPDTLKRLSKAYDYPYEELMKAAGYFDADSIIDGFEKVEEKSKEEQSPIPPTVKAWLRADTSGLTKDEQKFLAEDLADYFEYRKNKLLKDKENK